MRRMWVFFFLAAFAMVISASRVGAWVCCNYGPGRWPMGVMQWVYNPAPVGGVPGPNLPGGADAAATIAAITNASLTWNNDPGSEMNFSRHSTNGSEDANGNGMLDPGEDLNGNGMVDAGLACNNNMDGVNTVGWADFSAIGNVNDHAVTWKRHGEDANGNGMLDPGEDLNGNGMLDNVIVEADICFNTIKNWSTLDLETVAVHEWGHALNLNHTAYTEFGLIPPNGLRASNDYTKVVMFRFINHSGAPLIKRKLLCDDKAGVNYLYPPLAPPVMETRDYAKQVTGGCDFGDAPDPFAAIVGRYPSLENGEDANNNGVLDPPEDVNGNAMRDLGEDTKKFNGFLDPDEDRNGNGVLDFSEDRNANFSLDPSEDLNGNGMLDLGNGARHKDSRMEWLGPIGERKVTFQDNQLGRPVTVTLKPRNPAIPAPGNVVAGQTAPNIGVAAAVPASATFEPESRNPSLVKGRQDELDDGVAVSGAFRPGVPIFVGILVNTNGLAAGRYNGLNRAQRLYLNAWEDWNADRDWKDWAPPIAGGPPAAGPGPGPCAVPAAGNDEYILHWEGTPGSDDVFSPNFCVGLPVGPGGNTRLLIFKVQAPAARARETIFGRYRLDYGEDVGQNLADFTDPSLGAITENGTRRPVEPSDRLAGIGFDQGEAKYGEVEDYEEKTTDTRVADGSAGKTIAEKGIFLALAEEINLAGTTVTISSLLNEVGGAGELVGGLPLTLIGDPRNNEHVAIFRTSTGVRPIVILKIARQGSNEFIFRLQVSKITKASPTLCSGDPRKTHLMTIFTIDDGVNQPAVVSAVEAWRCFGIGDRSLLTP